MRRLAVLVAFVAVAGIASPTWASDVEGGVLTDRPTVVVLEARGGTPPTRPPQRVTMDQKNLAFVPFVLPVMRGDAIEFTNSDDVQHNVFSPSVIAGKFDLGTYGPGATRTVTFDQVGEVVVLCNIHMEMEARVLVVDTPYYATAADGRFRLADVSPGTYALRVWRGGWLPTVHAVDVPASGTVTIDLGSGS